MKQLHWKKCLMAVAIAFAGVLGAASFGPTGMTAKAADPGTAESPYEIDSIEKLQYFLLEKSATTGEGETSHGTYGILTENITYGGGIGLINTKVLDLNGKTLKGDTSTYASDYIINVDAGDSLTIKDSGTGGLIKNEATSGPTKVILVKSGSFTLDSGTIGNTCVFGVYVEGGTVDIHGGAVGGLANSLFLEAGTTYISNGALIENGIYFSGDSIVDITGARVKGAFTKVGEGSSLTLHGGYYTEDVGSISSYVAYGYTANPIEVILDGTTYYTHVTPNNSDPSWSGHALVLTNDIGIDFVMTLPGGAEEFPNCYMSFTGNNINEDHVSPVYYDGDKYKFTVHVSSIQMAEKITPTFHYGEETVLGTPYSVEDYIIAGKVSDQLTAKQKTIVNALADYGYHAQPYLSAINHWTPGEDYAAMLTGGTRTTEAALFLDDVKNKEAIKNAYFIKSGSNEDIANVTYTLRFGSKTSIYVFLTPVEGRTITSATVDGQAVTPAKSGNRYVVVIPDIYATALANEHTIVVGGMTINVSPYCYVRAMLNVDSDDSITNKGKNLVAALYYYAEACK